MRAAVYTRISLDREGSGQGVARQRADCEALCHARGWDVAQVIEENDTSATKGHRPGYARLVRLAEARQIDIIVGWAVDRITRTPREIEDLIEMSARTGVKVATVAGDLDLTTDSGRLVGRILASVARGEVERKGERQRAANLQRAEQGKVSVGGIRTLGYEPGMTRIIQREAKQIRDGFAGLLAGLSLRGIARQWNAAGFHTAHGGQWDGTSVRVVLRNVRYAGMTKHRGQVVGRGHWTPLVTEEVFAAVQSVLDSPDRRTAPTSPRRYLLAGLARCECGAKVITGRTQHGKRTYRCGAQRGHMSRAAAILDEYVRAMVVERLSRPDAIDLLTDQERPDVDALRDQANALRSRLADLSDTLADPGVPLLETRRAIATARDRLAAVSAEMADAATLDVLGPLVHADDVGEAWDGYGLDQQRAVIDVLTTVTLCAPGKGRRTFDPGSVRIEPK